MIKHLVSLLRPHQYVKNIFIFFPLFFGLRITDIHLLYRTFFAFIAFSMVASAGYIFNDYHDITEDAIHPKKRNRPLTSGKVSKKSAVAIMIFLMSAGFGISYMIDKNVFFLIVFYLILNLTYTLKLKHIAIIDVFTIATGFVLRLFVGSEVADIRLSMWIVLMTFLLALFLALAKRRDDILIYLESGSKTRKVIDGYNMEFLNSSMMVMASVVIVSYIMYTISPEVYARTSTDKLYLTVIFVILGIMRYMQVAFVEKASGSPTEILLRDRFIQLCILGWVVTIGVLIYRQPIEKLFNP